MTPTQKAVDILGGLTGAGRAMGVTPRTIRRWLDADRVPPERCLALEAAVQARVTRYELRPDVYGPAG